METGWNHVEKSQEIRMGREARRESKVTSDGMCFKVSNPNSHKHSRVGMVPCRRPWRTVEGEWGGDPGGDCVEESREIPESRELSGGSQNSSRERPAKTDNSNPPRQGVEGGTSDPRAVGLRDRDRAAQPELEEREREIAERETQAERHRAPAHVSEGGEVGCSINRPRGYRAVHHISST